MSRVSSAFLFQYNHPVEMEQLWPPKLKNVAPKSIITRMGQGFLQHAAFPLQFEFLFDFPGPLGEDELRGPEGGCRIRGRASVRGSNPIATPDLTPLPLPLPPYSNPKGANALERLLMAAEMGAVRMPGI